MNLTDNLKLLRDYADHGDEAAFRKLVERYVDMVYSAAFRRVGGDAGLAEDVTQTVFTDLARKASSLRKVELLGGWLHRHTGFVASNMVRSEQRRQIREQEAAHMNATQDSAESLWQQMAPMLDDTIEHLEPEDRQAILLRFFERHDFRHIGSALGISDDAAQKRVSRALDKLRTLLTNRGLTLSVVLLSTLLAGKVVAAAPSGLAASVAKVALAGAAVGSGIGLTLTKSLLFKVAVGGAAVGMALWMVFQRISQSTTEKKLPTLSTTVLTQMENSTVSANHVTSIVPPPAKASSINTTSNMLLLDIVAADSGKPVPDVELNYILWENGKVQKPSTLQATRFGVCEVPVPDDTSELRLVSERDGFADTMLDWNPGQGEEIPGQYTLQLARAVPIGGQVVDPDGNPVSGAVLRFGNRPDISSQTRPQSDNFRGSFSSSATTDSQGHWEFNRIGRDALKTIYGRAGHPDFLGTPFIPLSTDTETQLLAETYVFKLGRTIVVRGIVKDPKGQPVPNADVLVGKVEMADSREGKSQADGTFSIVGCEPGKNMITAQAGGFAATTVRVNLTDNSGPFELTLHPGKLLKLCVVDENGNPVPNADVRFDTWSASSMEPEPTQVEFHRQTDVNGRVQWENALEGELKFSVLADGYMNKRDFVKFRADGTEHIITVQHGLTISGTVSDAETRKTVRQFRILVGGQSYDPGANAKHFAWSALDDFLLSFSGSSFQHTWTTPPFGTEDKDPCFVFEFQADGYAPYITRAIHLSERNVHLEVALKPAPAMDVTVLTPNNELAANADIGFASWAGQLKLVQGGLSHNDVQGGGTFLVADSAGHFVLPSDPTTAKIIAASPQGYAQTTPAELATNPIVQLQAWGRLDGIVLTNGEVAADSTVSLRYNHADSDAIPLEFSGFQTKADHSGRFTFTRVPAGNFTVGLLFPFHDIKFDSTWQLGPSQPVTINSGETAAITIDSHK